MGINLGSNFDVQTALPLDSRDVVADLTARDAIVSGRRFIGMSVHCLSDSKNYQLVGGIANANWKEFAGSGGSGSFDIEWSTYEEYVPQYIQSFGQLSKFGFPVNDNHYLQASIVIPSNFVTGDLYNLNILSACATTGNYKFQVSAKLFKASTGSATQVDYSFQNVTSAGYQLNTVNVIAAGGTIGAASVAAGDVLQLLVTRIAASASDSVNTAFIFEMGSTFYKG
jgi:hypothetical protein